MARISQAAQDRQKHWEYCIARAIAVREDWKKRFRVEQGRDYFEGVQNPGFEANEWITINKVYSHLKATLPALYGGDPYFYIKLKRSFSPNPMDIVAWEARGQLRQAMLNYIKEENDLKGSARLCVMDAMFAFGVIKAKYNVTLQANPDAGNPMYASDGKQMLGDDGLPMYEPETIPINEHYQWVRVHPDDFLWDEDAGPLSDTWKYVFQCVRMTLAEAQADPRYNKAATKRLEGKADENKKDSDKARAQRKKGDAADSGGDGWQPWGDKKADPSRQCIKIWEIYDLKHSKWSVIAENGDVPLVDNEPLPRGVEKHPFAILRFTLRDDSPYPIPPVSQMLDPQREFNTARSQILTHRKRFNRKYEVFSGGLDELEISKLESGEDGTIIRKETPQQVVMPIQDAPLDQQRYMELAALEKDLIEVGGGVSAEARGIAGADSATQASILDQRLELKEGDAKGEVMEFVRMAARKMDQLIAANISRDEAVRVNGPNGEYWELVRAQDYEDIQGEYEYSVNVGATLPQLPQVERASFLAVLGILSNAPQMMMSKRLLQKLFEMHHVEDKMLLEEIYALGQRMMSGGMPLPGKQGSQPNVTEQNPASIVGGQAGGALSLNLPGAGNL